MRWAKASGRFQWEGADAACCARLHTAAAAFAGGKPLAIGPQLAGWDRSRTKDGSDRCCQQCGFDYFFAHDRSFLEGQRSAIAGNPGYQLFSRLGCNQLARACRESGLFDARAAQNVGTRYFLATEAAAGCGLSIQGQLPSGNRSRAKDGGNDCGKQRVLDGFFRHKKCALPKV
jgi:hypothetical protein